MLTTTIQFPYVDWFTSNTLKNMSFCATLHLKCVNSTTKDEKKNVPKIPNCFDNLCKSLFAWLKISKEYVHVKDELVLQFEASDYTDDAGNATSDKTHKKIIKEE